MRLIRCLALAAFTAGLAVLMTEAGTAADTTISKDDLRKLAKDLKATGKSKEEVRKILEEKLKALKGKPVPAPVAAAPAKPEPTPAAKPVAVAVRKPAQAPKSAAELAKMIDEHINKTLVEAKLSASPICSDEEFVRRVYLDITGVIPTGDQAKAFLDSTEPNKRGKLIDDLLASSNYGRHMADIWQAKLYPKDSANRFVLKEPFVQWLRDEFNKNTPWDRYVTNILAGTGTVEENPGVTFTLANRAVDKLTDHVGNHFLNIQLQCAQCHNHPFIKEWKQTDYWGVAAFFSKVNADRPKNGNKGGDNTKIGVNEGNKRAGGKDFFPEATKIVPPKFFRGEEPKLSASEPYRPALMQWMTNPDNSFFAKAMVNRTWAQLFGPGFVNPIEDMHDDNPASHPELLKALAYEFGHTGYDLKHLFRAICNSQTYQRTSKPTGGNDKDDDFFSHQTMKVMTPEQLYDSLTLVTGGNRGASPKNKPADNTKRGGGNARDQFVNFFLAGAEEPNATEYDPGIPQALRLMNSRMVAAGGVVQEAIKSGGSDDKVIEKIYLSALARRPNAAELKRLQDYISKNGTSSETYGDILWAVLNSSEFTMVR